MGREHPKASGKLDQTGKVMGEAHTQPVEGDERPIGEKKPEQRLEENLMLMEVICTRGNVLRAIIAVEDNKGCAGIDGIPTSKLRGQMNKEWKATKAALLSGNYVPKPVKRISIPKPTGGKRTLGIPSVIDRTIQQAVLQILQPYIDPTFSESSYGFRPNRSAHQAVQKGKEYVGAGHSIMVDIDLEKFFDKVNHDKLMSELCKRIKDTRVLKLIRGYLKAGVMEQGIFERTEEGTPQGSPLSPLLSNIMLDLLDKELESRGHKFVRYADDCNIYVRSQKAGDRVMETVKRFITKKLKLKVNESKSKVDKTSKRKFLGFRILCQKDKESGGIRARIAIAPESIERFKEKVKLLTQRKRSIAISTLIKSLNRYLQGWKAYYGKTECPSILKELDGWIRRRIRCYHLHQWKKGRTRYRELTSRGVSDEQAARIAGSSKGSWRLSKTEALHRAFGNQYLAETVKLVCLSTYKVNQG